MHAILSVILLYEINLLHSTKHFTYFLIHCCCNFSFYYLICSNNMSSYQRVIMIATAEVPTVPVSSPIAKPP